MSTIELTSSKLQDQISNIEWLLASDKYTIMLSVTPKIEMPLREYLQSSIHTDEKYGPFSDTKSLFASLDA